MADEGRTFAAIRLDDGRGEGVLGCEHGHEMRVRYGPGHALATKAEARQQLIDVHQQLFRCGCAAKLSLP